MWLWGRFSESGQSNHLDLMTQKFELSKKVNMEKWLSDIESVFDSWSNSPNANVSFPPPLLCRLELVYAVSNWINQVIVWSGSAHLNSEGEVSVLLTSLFLLVRARLFWNWKKNSSLSWCSWFLTSKEEEVSRTYTSPFRIKMSIPWLGEYDTRIWKIIPDWQNHYSLPITLFVISGVEMLSLNFASDKEFLSLTGVEGSYCPPIAFAQTYLESWNIEDFKNVHHFTVALFCQKSSPRFNAAYGRRIVFSWQKTGT